MDGLFVFALDQRSADLARRFEVAHHRLTY